MTSAADEGGLQRARLRQFRLRLALIAALGFVVRVGYLLWARAHPVSPYGLTLGGVNGDGIDYHAIAQNNLKGHWFISTFGHGPAAQHPPAWPLILTGVGALGFKSWFDQQMVEAIIGTLTVVAVGYAGRRLAGARAGLVAAVIAALYAGLWIYERALLSEPTVMLLVAVLIIVVYRFREQPSWWLAAGVGILCGVLAMTRAEQILLFVLVAVPAILGRRAVELRVRIWWLGAAALCVVLVVLPWTIYNGSRFDRPVLLSLGTGPAAMLANCSTTYGGPEIGFYSYRCQRVTTGDESDQAQQQEKLALTYSRNHAGQLPLVVVAREGRAFGFWNPFQQTQHDADWQDTSLWVNRLALWSFWLLVIPAVGGVVVLRRRKVAVYPLLAPFVVVAVSVVLTYGETRYRAPSEVALVLLAAVFIESLFRADEGSEAAASRSPSPTDSEAQPAGGPPLR